MASPSIFGQRLRETRKLRSWTQERLAKQFSITATDSTRSSS